MIWKLCKINQVAMHNNLKFEIYYYYNDRWSLVISNKNGRQQVLGPYYSQTEAKDVAERYENIGLF